MQISWIFCVQWMSAVLLAFLCSLWFGSPRLHQRVLVMESALSSSMPVIGGSSAAGMVTYDLADPFEKTLEKIQLNVLKSIDDRFPDVEAATASKQVVHNDPRLLMRTMQSLSVLDHTLKDAAPPNLILLDTQIEKARERLVRALGTNTVPSAMP